VTVASECGVHLNIMMTGRFMADPCPQSLRNANRFAGDGLRPIKEVMGCIFMALKEFDVPSILPSSEADCVKKIDFAGWMPPRIDPVTN
jgi:hypothetical protein